MTVRLIGLYPNPHSDKRYVAHAFIDRGLRSGKLDEVQITLFDLAMVLDRASSILYTRVHRGATK